MVDMALQREAGIVPQRAQRIAEAREPHRSMLCLAMLAGRPWVRKYDLSRNLGASRWKQRTGRIEVSAARDVPARDRPLLSDVVWKFC